MPPISKKIVFKHLNIGHLKVRDSDESSFQISMLFGFSYCCCCYLEEGGGGKALPWDESIILVANAPESFLATYELKPRPENIWNETNKLEHLCINKMFHKQLNWVALTKL